MGAKESSRVMDLYIQKLGRSLSGLGYETSGPPDHDLDREPGVKHPEWRISWFSLRSPIPEVNFALMAHLRRSSEGNIGISGNALLVSAAVEDILDELSYDSIDNFCGSVLDSIPFTYFETPQDMSQYIWVTGENGVDAGVREYMRLVDGPVSGWFSDRDDITKLLQLSGTARPNNVVDQVNPDPMRLRGSIVLAVLSGRGADAARVMAEYIGRGTFNNSDSREKARAFDAAMIRKFPVYEESRRAG
ncbi:hypothetical protein [Nocardia sp. BMG111209]|uniref:hypothetical protein n=1 Tax=Nocardia sp. BMG111209 TaxID=1160137 RepID=UPI0012DE6F78|nr:hypothetical protein [Nocardia sp. BMG111209]